MKKKTVKAWAPVDGKGKLLCISTQGDTVAETLFFIHASKEAAQKQWHPWKVVPLTITYTI